MGIMKKKKPKTKKAKRCVYARFSDYQGINSIFSLRNQNRLTLSLA